LIAGKLFINRLSKFFWISLQIFIVRSASLPISKDSKVSNESLRSAGIVGSERLVHAGIPLPEAVSQSFRSLFVILIFCNISIAFFAPPPALSLSSR
jgi:hypothetical protein